MLLCTSPVNSHPLPALYECYYTLCICGLRFCENNVAHRTTASKTQHYWTTVTPKIIIKLWRDFSDILLFDPVLLNEPRDQRTQDRFFFLVFLCVFMTHSTYCMSTRFRAMFFFNRINVLNVSYFMCKVNYLNWFIFQHERFRIEEADRQFFACPHSASHLWQSYRIIFPHFLICMRHHSL